ncbi:CrcB protein [Acidisarcina polymorpha]|uniref:Fluoride-specific ion channel FluC n=1 Tax=Acidisarcina polymorpha TaxID=2211140 RepID=A0A2Z5G7S9_9BACT|nr:fluoride efflux transporter CrcB [Acidisarcina polymorpha]AXC14754.1 CrcB protein [Acidisarcina polymorpha]
MKFVWVAIGGALGSLARYTLGAWIYSRMGTRFPYGTFVINITGCFVIGLALSILDAHTELPSAWRLAVPIGFVGAYTTFSTFEFETFRAAQENPAIALLYVGSSVVLGYGAVYLGIQTSKLFG